MTSRRASCAEEREASAQDGRCREVRHRQGEDHQGRLQQTGRHQRQGDGAEDLEIARAQIARAVLEVPIEGGQDVLDHEERQWEEGQHLAQDDAGPSQDPDVGPEGLVQESAAPAQDDERDTEDVRRSDEGQQRDEAERPAEPAGTAGDGDGDGEADGDGQQRDDGREDDAVSEREQEVCRAEELRVVGQREPGVALEARDEYARHGQDDEDAESGREDEGEAGRETCVDERGQAPRRARPTRRCASAARTPLSYCVRALCPNFSRQVLITFARTSF